MTHHTFRRTAAAATSGLLLAGVLAGVGPAGHAVESPGVDATYDCTIPIVGGSGPVTTAYRTNLPSTMYVGEGEPINVRIGTRGTLAWATIKQAWDILGARSLRNKSTMDISIGTTTHTVQLGGDLMVIESGKDVQLDSENTWGSAAWVPPTTPSQVQVRMPAQFTSALNFYKNTAGTQGTTIGANSTSTCTNNARPVIHTINVKARSTTTLQVASLNVLEDDPVEVSSEVQVTAGTAAGSVEFSTGPDASAKKVTVPVANGKASGLITGLPAGNYPVTARFVPAQPALYDSSSSTEQSVTVAAPTPAQRTSTTLKLDRASITSADQATATVEVTAEEGTPAGQARVTVNGQSVTEPLVEGRASVRLPRLRAGSYSVAAAFVPSKPRDFAASAAAAESLVVTPGAGGDLAPTSTWLEMPSSRVLADTPSTLEARVTSAGDQPVQGHVSFSVGTRQLSGRVINGRAVVAVPGLPVGSYQVGAEFEPEVGAPFEPSQAPTRTLSVVAAGAPEPGAVVATSTLVEAPVRATAGGRVAVSAQVRASGGGNPTGQVEFVLGNATLRAPVVNGRARALVPATAAGAKMLRATFRPAGAFGASSDFVSITIDRAASRTTLRATASKRKASKKSVTVTVRTAAPVGVCATPVTLTLTKGKVVRKKVVRTTCAGVATVKVKLTGKRVTGTWRVRATSSATANARASSGTVKVRVM